ncbi:MAG: MFS transporter [Thermomicrobiales bacterium]|nr:MFS transporter [Thermomicrobiales bacterium]
MGERVTAILGERAAISWRPQRLAVISFFLLAGLAFGSWVARIPDIKHRLRLDDAQLGFALLGSAVGAILAMSAAGWMIGRFGSRHVVVVAAAGVCLMLPVLPFAPSGPMLFVLLLLFGACYGTLDVAMNAQAVMVEERYARPIMSSFHGVFSVGGLLGAALAGLAAGVGLPPGPHLLAIAVALLALGAIAATRLIPAAAEPAGDGPSFAAPTGMLFGLGLIAFCVLVAEGAVADWSAVYLRDSLGLSAAAATTGFTAFSLTMAAGRFAGDGLIERLGPVRVVRYGGALVTLGLGAALLAPSATLTVVGFAFVGAGLAAAFPIVLSAAGRVPGVPAGTALAAVATAGYAGFLVGPPVIGFIAHAAGLRVGLGVVAVLGLAIVLLAGQARGAEGG